MEVEQLVEVEQRYGIGQLKKMNIYLSMLNGLKMDITLDMFIMILLEQVQQFILDLHQQYMMNHLM